MTLSDVHTGSGQSVGSSRKWLFLILITSKIEFYCQNFKISFSASYAPGSTIFHSPYYQDRIDPNPCDNFLYAPIHVSDAYTPVGNVDRQIYSVPHTHRLYDASSYLYDCNFFRIEDNSNDQHLQLLDKPPEDTGPGTSLKQLTIANVLIHAR